MKRKIKLVQNQVLERTCRFQLLFDNVLEKTTYCKIKYVNDPKLLKDTFMDLIVQFQIFMQHASPRQDRKYGNVLRTLLSSKFIKNYKSHCIFMPCLLFAYIVRFMSMTVFIIRVIRDGWFKVYWKITANYILKQKKYFVIIQVNLFDNFSFCVTAAEVRRLQKDNTCIAVGSHTRSSGILHDSNRRV